MIAQTLNTLEINTNENKSNNSSKIKLSTVDADNVRVFRTYVFATSRTKTLTFSIFLSVTHSTSGSLVQCSTISSKSKIPFSGCRNWCNRLCFFCNSTQFISKTDQKLSSLLHADVAIFMIYFLPNDQRIDCTDTNHIVE